MWNSKYKKAVNFEPLQVSMLDVVQTRFEGEDVKCWMDIQRGTYPNVSKRERVRVDSYAPKSLQERISKMKHCLMNYVLIFIYIYVNKSFDNSTHESPC